MLNKKVERHLLLSNGLHRCAQRGGAQHTQQGGRICVCDTCLGGGGCIILELWLRGAVCMELHTRHSARVSVKKKSMRKQGGFVVPCT